MNDPVSQLIGLVIAAGIVILIHRSLSDLLSKGPDRKVVLSLDCLAVVTLFGGLILNDIRELAPSTGTHAHTDFANQFLYVFGTLVTSLVPVEKVAFAVRC